MWIVTKTLQENHRSDKKVPARELLNRVDGHEV